MKDFEFPIGEVGTKNTVPGLAYLFIQFQSEVNTQQCCCYCDLHETKTNIMQLDLTRTMSQLRDCY